MFPESIGLAATWDTPLMHQIATGDRDRGPRQVQRGDSQRRSQPVCRANVLVAEHQYLSRSALGPRHGDLWRGSFPDGEHGRSICERTAGRQSEISWNWCRRPNTYAVHSGPEPLRHGFNVEVSEHDLEDTYLPAFRADNHGWPCGFDHVRLQRNRRRARLRELDVDAAASARRLGI